jgi:plasmid replication initiation protein
MQQNRAINTPETLGVTPRYVLQYNAISRSVHNFSAIAKKLTAMAMALIPPDLSTLTASFTFAEFCKALGYDKGGKSFKLFLDGLKECVNNTISIEIISEKSGKKIWQNYTWFTLSEFDEEAGVATMIFSSHLAKAILELKRAYSKILLKDIGELQSKYAIRILELAISYSSLMGKDGNKKHAWYFERSIKELRFILGIPEGSYKKTYLFMQKVIEGPVEEINNAGVGLAIKTIKIKHGRNLVGLQFDCKQVAKEIKLKCGQNKKAKIAKLELPDIIAVDLENRLEKELEHLRELYPDDFAVLYENELINNSVECLSEFANQEAAKWNALKQLRERYGIVK